MVIMHFWFVLLLNDEWQFMPSKFSSIICWESKKIKRFMACESQVYFPKSLSISGEFDGFGPIGALTQSLNVRLRFIRRTMLSFLRNKIISKAKCDPCQIYCFNFSSYSQAPAVIFFFIKFHYVSQGTP